VSAGIGGYMVAEVPRSLPVYHVELLPTEASAIPEDLRAAVTRVCAELTSVRSVYVCRVRQESLDGEVTESLRLAIEPLVPQERHGADPVPAADMRKLFAALAPAPDQSLGFPSGRALHPWKDRGVCLYPGPEGDPAPRSARSRAKQRE